MGNGTQHDESGFTVGEENKPRPIPIDSKRNRRGWGKKLKRKQYKRKQNAVNFSIFASNANGIKGKLDSLLSNIKFFGGKLRNYSGK